MTSRHRYAVPTTVLVALLYILLYILTPTPVAAQEVTFPRIGISGAPDHYQPYIEVTGVDPFDIYVIVLPAEGESTLEHNYTSFHWGILESCCGGAATIVGVDYVGSGTHEGTPYTGVTSVGSDCMTGDSILLCTVSLQMTLDRSGDYYVLGGPVSLAYDCEGEGVVMTDMTLFVNYTSENPTLNGEATLSRVKQLFAD